jgi:glucose-1-phosphate cytidylyltransferase
MKVVILAGGKGTRISEYTKSIPKPMIRIKKIPLIIYIMSHYARFGFKDFIIAAGYKHEVIKEYFKNKFFDWKIKIINTGNNTMTGGRVKRLKKYIKDELFLLTYGDGLSNVDIKRLIKFHIKRKAIVTLTAVRPPARFGVIDIKKDKVITFREKSSLDSGWINGGFFVMSQQVFKYIRNDQTFLERNPFIKLSADGKLFAYKHKDFWHCMDTVRDKEIIESIVKKKQILNLRF